MDWETGLRTINLIGIVVTGVWLGLKCSISCFNKIDIAPMVMWFKMLSIIIWITFFGLLLIYCIIGD